MDRLKNLETTLTKKNMNKEVDTSSSYVKCKINNSKDFSKSLHIDGTISMQTAKPIKKECGVEEVVEKNIEHMNFDLIILPETFKIKQEDMKAETNFDTLSDDHNSDEEFIPSKMVEFVEMQEIKIEEEREYDKEEDIFDPIYVNEDPNPVTSPLAKSSKQDSSIISTSDDETVKKTFNHSGTLNKHVSHTADRPYKCLQCNKAFRVSNNLNVHMRIHTGVKPYECSQCNKAFSQAINLTNHMRVHTGEKPFLCVQCNKSFGYLANLVRHKRIHTGEKPFKCTQCDKAFITSSNLACHMKIHTGEKPFECRECNKAFSQTAELIKHMRIHSGERPFACSECNKSFSHSVYLVRHKRIHSGDKPYKCTQCNKAFSFSGNLTVHMRIHTGEKPYLCKYCNKAFSRSTFLTKHMNVHTEKILS